MPTFKKNTKTSKRYLEIYLFKLEGVKIGCHQLGDTASVPMTKLGHFENKEKNIRFIL